MHSTFHILGMDFPAYFTMLMGGYTLVILLAHRDWISQGRRNNVILDLGILLILTGLLGARAMHVVADGHFMEYVYHCTDPYKVGGELLPGERKCRTADECVAAKKGELCDQRTGECHEGRDCLRPLKFWYGGLTFYGGLGLAALAGVIYMKRKKQPLWEIGDLAGYAIPLGLVFGRIGCFLAGCCFGRTCAAPPGIAFPKGSPAWQMHLDSGLIQKSAAWSLPVHPTQLYEAAACLLIFLWLYFWVRPRKRFSGQLFFLFCMAYAVARFAVEFLRADDRGEILGLSTSQFVGIPLFIYGAVMYFLRRRKGMDRTGLDDSRPAGSGETEGDGGQ
jgi:phosphatidylglycerol:prolipoprotein diacylglycerol transferase